MFSTPIIEAFVMTMVSPIIGMIPVATDFSSAPLEWIPGRKGN
jgi:hypothetical protein